MHSSGYIQDNPTSKPRPMTPKEKYQYQQTLLNDETKVGNDQILPHQQQEDKNGKCLSSHLYKSVVLKNI